MIALVAALLAQAPFQWETPPQVISDVVIEQTTVVAMVPVRLRRLLVKGSPLSVGQFYLESFKRQGLYVPPGMQVDRVLTGVRPFDRRTFTAMFDSPARGVVGVTLGEADPTLVDTAKPTGLDQWPAFPGATDVLVTRMERDGVMSFSARATADEVASFYRDLAHAQGLVPIAENSYRSAGLQLTVTAVPARSTPGTVRVSVLIDRSER